MLRVFAFLGLSAAQLNDFIHYHHKTSSKSGDLCLAAESPGSGGSQFGSLVLKGCATLQAEQGEGEDESTVWKSRDDNRMVLANPDVHHEHPCVMVVNSGGVFLPSFAYSEDGIDNCQSGFRVDSGYWVLDFGDGTVGCVAYEGTDNFYVAKCSGAVDTCKDAEVSGKKCDNKWKREGTGGLLV